MIKGVFFDLFGTLLIYTDMRKAWDNWLLALFENFQMFGLKMSKDSFAMKCEGFFKKPEPSLIEPDFSIYELRILNLGLDFGLKLKNEEIRETAMDTINSWQKYVPLDPTAISILETLKQSKKLALISNFDHPPHVYSILSDLNLKAYFDSIIISSEVGVKKPNPLIFSFALEQTRLNSNEVCYIGDTKEDMEAAIKANIYPILIQRNRSSEYELIDDYYLEKSAIIQNDLEIDFKTICKITDLKELISFID
ncbi:MAG: HAD family hydrolase [Promethearchaeota archaeon]|jgi:HAD superfamily hydrolase (TIGR01549 family)